MGTDRLPPLQPFVPPPPPVVPPPPPVVPVEPELTSTVEATPPPVVPPLPLPPPTLAGDSADGLVGRARGNTGELREPSSGAAALPGKYRSLLFPGGGTSPLAGPPAIPAADPLMGAAGTVQANVPEGGGGTDEPALELPEPDATTDEVEEQLDNATKDDDETAEDLREAAEAAKTPEDLAAIIEVAEREGQDKEAVLRKALEARDEGADTPNQTMYDAIADQYEALGKTEMAAAVRAAGNPDITKEVRHDLTQALQDGDETSEDLEDAAKHAKTPEDLQAIMDAQAATGAGEPEDVLRAALRARDEGAENPNETMYNAIADQYEAIGDGTMAAAVRMAGDPGLSKDVRHDLTQALQDGDQTAEDLQDAAKNARSAQDVEAIMKAQEATGASDKHDILQHVLLGQDENAQSPNTEVFEAVAKEWEALGDNQRAIAARAAGDPAVDYGVREKLVHALQDDKDTAEDIKRAFEIVEFLKEQPVQYSSTGMPLNQPWAVADDYKAAFEAGKATIGEAHTAQLDATVKLDDVVANFEDEQKAVEKLDARLAGMLGRVEGAIDPEGQAKLVEDFKAKYADEYGALETARDELAQVVTDNQDALADALSSPEALDEVDVELLEKALAASASSEVGQAAVEDIATAMLKNVDALPKERQELLTEQVMPIVMERAMQRALVSAEGDAKQAIDTFENTPFGQAVAGIDTAATSVGSIKEFATGYKGISTALREGRARELGTVIEEQAALSESNRLSGSLAGVGLALGAVAFGNAEGFSEHAQAALDVAGSGGELLQSFSGTMAALQEGGTAAKALARGVPVINVVAGTFGAVGSFKEGDAVGGTLGLAGVGLALAALAGVPGANVAAAVVAVGAIAWSAWKAHEEKGKLEDELDGILKDQGVESGLRKFLVENDPGTYEETKEKLGLSDAQLAALVEGDSDLRRNLDNIAKDPATRDFHEAQARATGQSLYDYLLTQR